MEFLTPQHHRHHHHGPAGLRLPQGTDSQLRNDKNCPTTPGSEDFELPPRPQSAPAHQTTSPRRIPSVSSSGRQSPVEVHREHQQTRYHLNPEQENRLKGRFGDYTGTNGSPLTSHRLRLSPDHRRPSQCSDRDSVSCLAPDYHSDRLNVSYGGEQYLSDCNSDVFLSDTFGEEPRSPTLSELSRVERHRKWSRGERSKTVDAPSTRQKSFSTGSKDAVDPGRSLIATWPKDEHCHVIKESGEYRKT